MANGEADIAIGTDTAGSGRVPAGLQGIVGIKPTVGVISVVPACESYDCVTIFAPDLDLANRAMRVMAAAAGDRPWPADVRLSAPPAPVVAVPDELPALDRQWRASFDAAVTALAEAGARRHRRHRTVSGRGQAALRRSTGERTLRRGRRIHRCASRRIA